MKTQVECLALQGYLHWSTLALEKRTRSSNDNRSHKSRPPLQNSLEVQINIPHLSSYPTIAYSQRHTAHASLSVCVFSPRCHWKEGLQKSRNEISRRGHYAPGRPIWESSPHNIAQWIPCLDWEKLWLSIKARYVSVSLFSHKPLLHLCAAHLRPPCWIWANIRTCTAVVYRWTTRPWTHKEAFGSQTCTIPCMKWLSFAMVVLLYLCLCLVSCLVWSYRWSGISRPSPGLTARWVCGSISFSHEQDFGYRFHSLPSSKSTFLQPLKDKCISELVTMIIFYLSKLWPAYTVFLVRLLGNFEIDHS